MGKITLAEKAGRNESQKKPCDSEKERKIRIEGGKADVYILPERCKGCEFCIRFCPKEVLKVSDDLNAKGYRYPAANKPEECGACMMCEYLCPDFAIYVLPRRKKKSDSQPK